MKTFGQYLLNENWTETLSNGDIVEYEGGQNSLRAIQGDRKDLASLYIKKKDLKLIVKGELWGVVYYRNVRIIGVKSTAKAFRLSFDTTFESTPPFKPHLVLRLKFLDNILGNYYTGVGYSLQTLWKDLLEKSSRQVREYVTELVEEYLMSYKKLLGFDYLASVGVPCRKVQEYVIQNRPDLINKIPNLLPDLKEKHQQELNVSKIDI